MRFIPVQFRLYLRPIVKTDRRNALHLTPPTTSVLANQTPPASHATSRRDSLCEPYVAIDLERHVEPDYPTVALSDAR